MTVKEYAEQLLKDNECSLDTYRNQYREALLDIQEYAKTNDVPFALEAVVNALVKLGNEQPEKPKKEQKQFMMIFDVGHTVDGIEFETFEEAKNDAIWSLETWMCDEMKNFKFENQVPRPTEEQIESWNQMIADCSVCVVEWDDETGNWQDSDDGWRPDYELEYELNWLKWSELVKKYNWKK